MAPLPLPGARPLGEEHCSSVWGRGKWTADGHWCFSGLRGKAGLVVEGVDGGRFRHQESGSIHTAGTACGLDRAQELLGGSPLQPRAEAGQAPGHTDW